MIGLRACGLKLAEWVRDVLLSATCDDAGDIVDPYVRDAFG